jgi:hypothetical protein
MNKEKLRKAFNVIDKLFAIAMFSMMALISWELTLILLGMIVVHEIGHYCFAKREGLYKGYTWGMFPSIQLKHHGSRLLYASGFLFSLTFIPFLLMFNSNPVSAKLPFILFYLAAALGVSLGDFLVIAFYGKLKKS